MSLVIMAVKPSPNGGQSLRSFDANANSTFSSSSPAEAAGHFWANQRGLFFLWGLTLSRTLFSSFSAFGVGLYVLGLSAHRRMPCQVAKSVLLTDVADGLNNAKAQVTTGPRRSNDVRVNYAAWHVSQYGGFGHSLSSPLKAVAQSAGYLTLFKETCVAFLRKVSGSHFSALTSTDTHTYTRRRDAYQTRYSFFTFQRTTSSTYITMGARGLLAHGVPPMPQWLIFVKGAIIVLSLIILALSAYAISLTGSYTYYYSSGVPGYLIFLVSLYHGLAPGISNNNHRGNRP
jgi:hypothetical protein